MFNLYFKIFDILKILFDKYNNKNLKNNYKNECGTYRKN